MSSSCSPPIYDELFPKKYHIIQENMTNITHFLSCYSKKYK